MKRLTRNPILVLLAFWAVFLLLLRTESWGVDRAIDLTIWAALLVMSAIAIFKMVRHRRVQVYGQDATLPDRIRQWVLDEPDGKDRRRTG